MKNFECKMLHCQTICCCDGNFCDLWMILTWNCTKKLKFWNFKSNFLFMPLPFKYLPFYYLLIYRTTNARNRAHSATRSGPYFFHFDYFTKRSHFPYKNFKLVSQIVDCINWAENLYTSSKQYVLKLWQTKHAYL